ncbi:MAG: single-stranded-DNA-specific exonuclease RecJ [Rickettsiales bacterium]|jgi:single-stranded-DNA-specific exonuclease|nr:single-stranded-DNA-specific exonuclease RecJ [Rickettsiales bacterium]
MKYKDRESVKGYFWNLKDYDEKLALTIYQKKNVSELVSRLLAIKNLSLEEIDDYLDPRIKNLLKSPFHLLDMQKAVEYIYDAILSEKKICIFGDYDVDGATATALMVMYFSKLNIKVDTFIPDRMEDGYGVNEQAINKLKEDGVQLIITVDCGISANEPIRYAKNLGIDVIVTDHHLGSRENPPAVAVVNPNRLDETSEYKYLAGVGVAYVLCIGLNSFLREKGFFEKHHLKEPDLLYYLDLVALGTVCDVMPLVNINRAFVKQGLKVFRRQKNVGLKALSDLLELDEVNDTYHLGYILGPRINASGRVGDVNIGNKLLSCGNKIEARYLAQQLEAFNTKRQNIEKEILAKAIQKIDDEKLYENSAIFIYGNDWHEGVIGIIASRIKDKYNRPVFALSMNGDAGKASCRSVDKSIDIGSLIIRAKEMGLLLSGGGHAMAGGFTFSISKLEEIKGFMIESISKKLNNYLTQKEKYADLVVDFSMINEQCISEIENMGPFGTDNAKPNIILNDIVILSTKKFGKNKEHLRCVVGRKNDFNLDKLLVANIFRVDENITLINALKKPRLNCDLVGSISINKWMNLNNVQFIIEDIILREE